MTIKFEIGDIAPEFRLPVAGGAASGNEVSLADFAGNKLLLFFYPKDNTQGCTSEAIDFSIHQELFNQAGCKILGVSADSISRHQKFIAKHKLTVPLLSDENHTMLKAYGVWGEKKLYGKTFLGITRTSFLIDEKSKILHIWHKVKVKNHVQEVLEVIRDNTSR